VSGVKTGLAPYIAAAIVASLTIRVFYELQDYGPESVIRRFYNAVGNLKTPLTDGEINDLQKVTTDRLMGRAQAKMIERLREWDAKGATMEVMKVDSNGTEARAAVVFDFPKGTPMTMVWVVERRNNVWLVDVNKTATILSDQFGF